jgi:putative oxidoreductase
MCFPEIARRLQPLKDFSDRVASPVVMLAARLMVAKPFFVSGKLKLGYILDGQEDTLYFLFEDYHVPLLPVKVAAWMGMMGELGLSTLLALGLFARFGALGLIVMSAVIYNADGNQVAPLWATICAVVAARGAGKLSIDALLFRDKTKK